MNEKIYLDSEFDRIWKKIKANENITFLRFADGERAIMTGTPVHAQEGGWSSPSYVSKLGKDLLSSLTIDDNNVYYAISCPCCDQPSFYWYYTRIINKNITFANLWINANYDKFLNSFESLNREVVVIANFRAKDKAIGNLKILKFYPIGDDCISFWENEAAELINSIKNDFGNRDNLLYVVSAGPMSEPIIHALFNNNPNNSYIDFGSSIDKYYRGAITRPYMIKGTPYYNKNCWLPGVINTSVSVVLTLYKRPEKLLEQINAILNQTIKPKEIIVFHDASNFVVDELLIREVKNKVDNYIKVENNVGVWGRFAGGLIAKSKYICFFDDDTIPGIRWLENCYTNIINKKGLYGTIGIDSWDLTKYPYDCYRRWGWHAPCDKTIKVDFVGHSWFLEKDWLGVMWINSSDIYSFKYVGEDAFLSFSLKKWLNINTYVPPHPIDNIDLYGSQPEKALKYGTESDVAISFNPQQLENMNLALKELVKKGMNSQGHKGFNLSDIFQTSFFKTLFPNESVQKKIAKKLFKTFNL